MARHVDYGGLRTLMYNNPRKFLPMLADMLGLAEDNDGNQYVRPDRQFKPEAFSLKGLARAICGEDFYEACDRSRRPQRESLNLMEDGSIAVQPTAFGNISAFNATTALLIEIKILEGYTRPEFAVSKAFDTVQTQQVSQKLIATSLWGDFAEEMKPGQAHPRGQFTERYVITPETRKRGMAVDVTKEAVFFDLTGQVLSRAGEIGGTLGLRREKLCVDVFIGKTNPYNYKGTTYNTYLTSGNWVNKISGLQLVDWTAFNSPWVQLTKMTDQETGQLIHVQHRDVLCTPYRAANLARIMGATQIAQVDNQANAVTQRTFSATPPQIMGMFSGQQIASPYVYERLTDADGSNLSDSNAREYFWTGDFKMAFAYMQNWDLQILRANPDSYTMADQGLIFSAFADEMGIPTVREPRAVILCYNT